METRPEPRRMARNADAVCQQRQAYGNEMVNSLHTQMAVSFNMKKLTDRENSRIELDNVSVSDIAVAKLCRWVTYTLQLFYARHGNDWATFFLAHCRNDNTHFSICSDVAMCWLKCCHFPLQLDERSHADTYERNVCGVEAGGHIRQIQSVVSHICVFVYKCFRCQSTTRHLDKQRLCKHTICISVCFVFIYYYFYIVFLSHKKKRVILLKICV